MEWKLGFVGAGVMAEVMIAGLLEEGILTPQRIICSNRRSERAAELSERYGVLTTLENCQVAPHVDVLVLSVKPQNLAEVLREIRGSIRPETLVLSIVAGARMDLIHAALDHQKVARCMPNLPCRIRKGMSVWAAPKGSKPADLERVRSILQVMGEEIHVEDEGHVDRATAVNGTGPAIVAQFVKAMLEAATFIGESRSVAQETVLSTLVGTAEMIRASAQEGIHVAQLIDEVTSPGGTTSRALQVLKQGHFSAVLTEAVDAAYQRTLALGEDLDKRLRED
jgi:pyrroline-5-carboxylate reductase